MKGFRQVKEPSKAELKKQIADLIKAHERLQFDLTQFKQIVLMVKNCETLEDLKKVREVLKQAEEELEEGARAETVNKSVEDHTENELEKVEENQN